MVSGVHPFPKPECCIGTIPDHLVSWLDSVFRTFLTVLAMKLLESRVK